MQDGQEFIPVRRPTVAKPECPPYEGGGAPLLLWLNPSPNPSALTISRGLCSNLSICDSFELKRVRRNVLGFEICFPAAIVELLRNFLYGFENKEMTFARKNYPDLNQAFSLQKFIAWIFLVACLPAFAAAQVATVDDFTLAEGFEAELVYSVPDGQGSWVSLTTDPKGRLIACDQYGGIYRITMTDGKAEVALLDLNLGGAQGLLCAFDSLYVMTYGIKNGKHKCEPGFYRVQDTNGDDQYDKVEHLQKIVGRGEHGAHAIVLSPDKKSLFICAGNMTALPPLAGSRQPEVWQEDQVIKRFFDPRGHATGVRAPGGWICKTDPQGKSFELIANGFRNAYDIAFDPNGELFTFDSDMEYDIGLPWYRATRVCQAVSGAEFGWRTGTGKWPQYYADSVAPVLNVGPGSPTGVTFGTGAKFPAKYQNCFFISDWSYGAIYAIHLTPDGASFTATKERLCAAPALPVTDIVVNPADGNIYFATGGRRSDSALYCIKYVGSESTAPATYPAPTELAVERRKLEAGHKAKAKIDMESTIKALTSTDRSIRYAARIAIEHQPSSSWTKDIGSQPTQVKLELAMALTRVAPKEQALVVETLSGIDFASLSWDQKMHLIRDYDLVLCRMGDPTETTKQAIQNLEANFPTGDQLVDQELARLLVAGQSPTIVAKLIEVFKKQDTQEAQVATALTLSEASVGWTQDLHRQYFQTMLDNANSRGGNSFDDYVRNIRQHAISKMPEKDAQELAGLLARRPEKVDPYAELKARPVVKSWTVAELLPTDETKLAGRDLVNGKKMFAVATCYKCHRVHRKGGVVGPDLTVAGRRFGTKDLLEAIVEPSKSISDQYEAQKFLMEDGRVVIGRVVNLSGSQYHVQPDMTDPSTLVKINVDEIEESGSSKVSPMPNGLLDTLTEDEILDLLAYMKSTADEQE